MGLADLQTIDVVATEDDGTEGLHIVAGNGWPPEREALYHVQLLVKLTGMLHYAETCGKRCSVTVHSADEPPAGVLEFLSAAGVRAVVGLGERERPAVGRLPRFPNLPDGSPDLDALQAANAADFAGRHGLDGTVESLHRLDEVLEARRREEGLGPDDTDEEFADGDLIVLGGAYAGEVLRSAAGGRWVLGREPMIGPLHVAVGPPSDEMAVNMLGKVRRYLRYGSEDSVRSMVSMVLARLNGGRPSSR